MQYSAKTTKTSTPDEEVQTFMTYLSQINKCVTYRANLNYLDKFNNEVQHLCIVDGGADSHVGGKAWLSLVNLKGPCIRYANVVGFDEHTSKKFGLPIGDMVAKYTNSHGITKFL